jgi:hypothetical protein
MSLKRMESSTRENPMMVFNRLKKAGGDFMTVESFRKLASERMEVPLVPGVIAVAKTVGFAVPQSCAGNAVASPGTSGSVDRRPG